MAHTSIIYTFGTVAVDNTEKPLRYQRGDSVVVFQYYQQKYVTLRTRVQLPFSERWNYSTTSLPTSYC